MGSTKGKQRLEEFGVRSKDSDGGMAADTARY